MIRKFVVISFVYILCGFSIIAHAQSIAYPTVNKFTYGKVIDTIRPIVSGDMSLYAINHNLPHNLSLDPAKGIITGTPNEILIDTNYTITAKDKTGKSVTFNLVIKVLPSLPNSDIANSESPKNEISPNFAVGWVIFLCLILIVFIIIAAFRAQIIKKEALGFPRGSIRSLIAILFIIFFALLSVMFYFDSGTGSTHNADLAKQILTILGTLVTAVSAFYFGAKATEQGHQIAADAFQMASGKSGIANVPLNIIQEAIQNNKAAWVSQYGCQDIIPGKKVSNGIVQNVNCLVFLVASKDNTNNNAPIPSTICYTSNGTTYNIPTDVQLSSGGMPTNNSNTPSGDTTQQDQIIQSAIDQNKAVFSQSNISSVMQGKMLQGGQLVNCISVHLKDSVTTGYPTSITVDDGDANPTIVPIDYITDVDTPTVVGASHDGAPIANNNTSAYKGTVCCRLQKNNSNSFYLLTCSHVMTNGSNFNYGGNLQQPQAASPFGSWVWGMRTDDMDAALIAMDPSDQFSYHIAALQGQKPRVLTSADIMTTDIFMAGRNVTTDQLNIVQGKITNYSSLFPINVGYTEGDTPISGLIILSVTSSNGDSTTYNTLSVGGDSGALIYDINNNPIGMVIAGNSQFTYAIPLSTILLNTQSKIG